MKWSMLILAVMSVVIIVITDDAVTEALYAFCAILAGVSIGINSYVDRTNTKEAEE